MSLTDKDVMHVARLAAIALTPEEVERTKNELNAILGYIEKLQEVSSLGVLPTSHVHGVVNFFRDDIIKDSLPLEEVKQNAPDFVEGGFRVPKIL